MYISHTIPQIDLDSQKLKISKKKLDWIQAQWDIHEEVSITYFLNPMNHYVGQ